MVVVVGDVIGAVGLYVCVFMKLNEHALPITFWNT